MRSSLMRQAAALARDKMSGAPREQRIAAAKRKYEIELRAAGMSRAQAKLAVRVRFDGAADGD